MAGATFDTDTNFFWRYRRAILHPFKSHSRHPGGEHDLVTPGRRLELTTDDFLGPPLNFGFAVLCSPVHAAETYLAYFYITVS
jgi:hypothetical protein